MPKSSSIVFELADQSAFDFPFIIRVRMNILNSCLRVIHGDIDNSDLDLPSQPDAFGVCDTGRDESFPNCQDVSFGNINLRAMSRESLCQLRTGLQRRSHFLSVKAFVRGAKTPWSGSREMSGRSEHGVTLPELAEQPPFCSHIRQTLPMIHHHCLIFSAEKKTRTVLKPKGTLKLVPRRSCNRYLVAKRLPKQMMLSFLSSRSLMAFAPRCYTLTGAQKSHILESAEKWRIGCLNHPEIRTRQFGPNKGDNPLWRIPLTPFVAEVVSCANTIWIRGGSESSVSKSATMADALSLLLDGTQRVTRSAEKLLGLILKNSTSLLLAMGQAEKLGRVHSVVRNLQKQQLYFPESSVCCFGNSIFTKVTT